MNLKNKYVHEIAKMEPPDINDQGSFFKIWFAAQILMFVGNSSDRFVELKSDDTTSWANSWNEKQLTIVGANTKQISYVTLPGYELK